MWGELRRRSHIDLEFADLDGQVGRIDDLPNGRRRITLDAGLCQTDRRAALAHELVHDERGILFTRSTPIAVIDKEESFVRDETAIRLVPVDILEDFVTWLILDNGSTTWREIAEEFDVPKYVAERALELLQCRSRLRHPSARQRPTSGQAADESACSDQYDT